VNAPITKAAEGFMVETKTGYSGMAVFSSVSEGLERELATLRQQLAEAKEEFFQ